jgi:hypothetical protein
MGCSDDDAHRSSPTPTAIVVGSTTATPSRRATATQTLTATPTPHASATATGAPSETATATCVCTVTVTTGPTRTPNPVEPLITFFGIARADDLPLASSGTDEAGRPIFVRVQGQGMTVVVEARRGQRRIIQTAYDPDGGRRGVELLVSRPLGDGNPAVCDTEPPLLGGIPGFDPPVFSDDAGVQSAIDDFGCRVNDGTGAPLGRIGNACTRTEPTFEYSFVDPTTEVQFCAPIAPAWNFPVGDTIVAARVRDEAGVVSETREIVVRVPEQQPFTCDEGLGERTITVGHPPGRLISSAETGEDASIDPWLPATLRICAGAEAANGIHPLNLRDDAVLGVSLAGGGTLCTRIAASGSSGSLHCTGGTAADVLARQDEDALTRIVTDEGLGVDAGTGAAVLRAPISVVELAAGSSPDDCAAATYPQPFRGVLTTATGTAQVITLAGAVTAQASATGGNFDCAHWQDGGGTFVLPFPVVNGPRGDVADVLVLPPAP